MLTQLQSVGKILLKYEISKKTLVGLGLTALYSYLCAAFDEGQFFVDSLNLKNQAQ